MNNSMKTIGRTFNPAYIFAAIIVVLAGLTVSRITDGQTVTAQGADDHARIEMLNGEIAEFQKQLLDEGLEYDKHRIIMEEAQVSMSYHADMANGIRSEVSKRQTEIDNITARKQVPKVEEKKEVTESVKK